MNQPHEEFDEEVDPIPSSTTILAHYMPTHMHNVDLEYNFQDFEYINMLDREEIQHLVEIFFEAMHFEPKEEVQHALQWYYVNKGSNYNTKLLNLTKLMVKCDADGCAWK